MSDTLREWVWKLLAPYLFISREKADALLDAIFVLFAEEWAAAEARETTLREALDKIERETIDKDIQQIARAALAGVKEEK